MRHQLEEKQALFSSIESEYIKLSKRLETQWNLRIKGEISKEHFQVFYKPAQEQLEQLSIQLPQLQAEIDFMKIQQLSSDVVVNEANNLFANWLSLPFAEKRSIVEVITQRIEISKDSINIDLAYLPNQTLFNQTSTQGNATISM